MCVELPVKIAVMALVTALAGCAGLWGFDPLSSSGGPDAGADGNGGAGGGGGGAGVGCDGSCTGGPDGSAPQGHPCVLDTAAIDQCTLQ